MNITKTGKYRFIEDYKDRGTISGSNIKKGTVIEITRVDLHFKKVLSPSLKDWNPNYLPVEEA